jgi:hypothetical protein
MARRQFHISDVLSISTGRLVSTRLMDGIYDILNFMTGDDLFTHVLPRAARECKPYLFQQHPSLDSISTERLDVLLEEAAASEGTIAPESAISCWIEEECQRLGIPEMLEVETIPMDDHDVRDPVVELEDMVGKDRILCITTDTDDENGESENDDEPE